MPKEVKHRRGTTAAHALFTGAQGEVTFNTSTNRLHSHDGSTAGGHAAALLDEVLLKDSNLSDLGNAETARGNLGVISENESLGIAGVRRLGSGLYFHGLGSTLTQRIYAPLDSYSIGTRHFTLRMVFRVPSSISVNRCLGFIGSSSSAVAANSFAVLMTATGQLQARLYGASTTDYTYANLPDFVSTYGGQVVELLVIRSFDGLKVYINGEAGTVGTTSSFGTGPGWLGSITSTYLVFGTGLDNDFAGELYGLSLFNYEIPADLAALMAREGIQAPDQWVDDAELITDANAIDFGAASTWVNDTMATYDASGDLSISSDAAGQVATLPDASIAAIAPGKRYQIVCTVSNLSGTFHFEGSFAGQELGTISEDGTVVLTFVAEDGMDDLDIVSDGTGSVDIDNITIREAGAVVDFDFPEASSRFLPDRSTNEYHGRLAATLGTPQRLYEQRRGSIRARTNTNGNELLLGQACLPSNARISAIIINSDNSGTATTSVNIGTSSGGAEIASAVAVASGRNEVGTFLSRYTSGGSIWIAANGDSNLDITILFDLVD